MRIVKLISAVKMDDPFVITGDIDAILTLSDAAAEFAIQQGHAVDAGHIPVMQLEPLIPDKPRVIDPADLLSDEGRREAEGQATVFDTPEEPEPPKRPYGNQPKSMWAAYAAAVDPDMTVERASDMTKADLMSRYGERL